MPKKSVSFSLRDDQYEECTQYADRKGMTLSQFAKISMFNYMLKYPGRRVPKSTPSVPPETDAEKG